MKTVKTRQDDGKIKQNLSARKFDEIEEKWKTT